MRWIFGKQGCSSPWNLALWLWFLCKASHHHTHRIYLTPHYKAILIALGAKFHVGLSVTMSKVMCGTEKQYWCVPTQHKKRKVMLFPSSSHLAPFKVVKQSLLICLLGFEQCSQMAWNLDQHVGFCHAWPAYVCAIVMLVYFWVG